MKGICVLFPSLCKKSRITNQVNNTYEINRIAISLLDKGIDERTAKDVLINLYPALEAYDEK